MCEYVCMCVRMYVCDYVCVCLIGNVCFVVFVLFSFAKEVNEELCSETQSRKLYQQTNHSPNSSMR
eukprot:m.107615 g.107615  ORF g.107615 m.107615 type:complete len:66 (-) comp12693_c0_seq2:1104-1301(-)